LEAFGIPTLEDVFQLIDNQCFINIEIKDAKATKAVLELIQNKI